MKPMSWLTIAVIAQLLFAVTVLIDKHIVVRAAHVGRPLVYAFYVAALSGFVVMVLPFGIISLPNAKTFVLSLMSASAFFAGLYCLFSALRVARASDVAPVVGAFSSLTVVVLAWFLHAGDVGVRQLPAILFLVVGTALISHFHFRKHALRYVLCAGAAFGAAVFLAKLVYAHAGFVDGFFWTRLLVALLALSLLAVPSLRRVILHGGRQATRAAKTLILGNKVIGSVAGVLTAYAVSLGSVAVVNALSGLQFAFLFFFALLFARFMPRGDDPATHGHGGWRTGLGVASIVLGLALLYTLDGFL